MPPIEMTSKIRKKRVSKKSKQSWRKHSHIDDVEEFLEVQRLDERRGPPLETVPDDQLFELGAEPTKELLLSTKERRKLLLERPPRCFSILQPFTEVPDPISKRNRVRTKQERKNPLIKNKEEHDRLRGIIKKRKKQAIDDRKIHAEKKKGELKPGEFRSNIWEEDEETPIDKEEWVEGTTKQHLKKGTGQFKKAVVKSVRTKPSPLPAIEPPHPGTSYNPSFEDHQALLREIAEKEIKIIKEEEHINRVTNGMFSRVTEQQREKMWLEEMTAGLIPETNKIKEEPESDDDSPISCNPPVRNKKKSAQQRRKQKENQKLELARKLQKMEKRKAADINQIRLLKKKIEKGDKKTATLSEKRKKLKSLKVIGTKRLAPTKFEDIEHEFNMMSDISGNLRNLKKEGNLLVDRIKSLQKRNLVEPTVVRHVKKAKVKRFVKNSHKIDINNKIIKKK